MEIEMAHHERVNKIWELLQQTNTFKVLEFSQFIKVAPPNLSTFWGDWNVNDRESKLLEVFNLQLDNLDAIANTTNFREFNDLLTSEQIRLSHSCRDWFPPKNALPFTYMSTICVFGTKAPCGMLCIHLPTFERGCFSWDYEIANVYEVASKRELTYPTPLTDWTEHNFTSLGFDFRCCIRAYVPPIPAAIFIQGDDDGDKTFKDFFARDIHLMDAISNVSIVNNDANHERIRSYFPKRGNLIKQMDDSWLLQFKLNASDVSQELGTEQLAGILTEILGHQLVNSVIIMYSGHGYPSGEWVLFDGESFSYDEFAECLPPTNVKADVRVTLFLNNCYSHLFCSDTTTLENHGVRIVYTTTYAKPLCPPGGIIELLEPEAKLESPINDPITMMLQHFCGVIKVAKPPDKSNLEAFPARALSGSSFRMSPDVENPLPSGLYIVRCGTGDSILLVDDKHDALLIDGGPQKHSKGRLDKLLKRVKSYDILITHSDSDHVSMAKGLVEGLSSHSNWYPRPRFLFANIPPDERNVPAGVGRSIHQIRACYKHMSQIHDNEPENAWFQEVQQGDFNEHHQLQGFTLEIVNPGVDDLNSGLYAEWKNKNSKKPNECSVCLEVTRNNKKVLLTADATMNMLPAELKLRSYDLIQVPHHGSSKNSMEEDWEDYDCTSFFVSGHGKKFNGTPLPETTTLDALPSKCKLYNTYYTSEVLNMLSDVEVQNEEPDAEFDFFFFGFDDNGITQDNV